MIELNRALDDTSACPGVEAFFKRFAAQSGVVYVTERSKRTLYVKVLEARIMLMLLFNTIFEILMLSQPLILSCRC